MCRLFPWKYKSSENPKLLFSHQNCRLYQLLEHPLRCASNMLKTKIYDVQAVKQSFVCRNGNIIHTFSKLLNLTEGDIKFANFFPLWCLKIRSLLNIVDIYSCVKCCTQYWCKICQKEAKYLFIVQMEMFAIKLCPNDNRKAVNCLPLGFCSWPIRKIINLRKVVEKNICRHRLRTLKPEETEW